MSNHLTAEEKIDLLLHPDKMDPDESDAAFNRMADAYQWTAYEAIVAERFWEKNLPQAERKEYLRERGQEITFDGCECLREIEGKQLVPGASRFFEFRFSGCTPGAKPVPDMRIELRTVSGIERFALYQEHSGNRVTVEIDMESHHGREMKFLWSGDTIEFLLPYQVGGQAIKRFRYICRNAWYLPVQPDIFETPDGKVRDTLPRWKDHLFWVAEKGRCDPQAQGVADDRRRATGTGR